MRSAQRQEMPVLTRQQLLAHNQKVLGTRTVHFEESGRSHATEEGETLMGGGFLDGLAAQAAERLRARVMGTFTMLKLLRSDPTPKQTLAKLIEGGVVPSSFVEDARQHIAMVASKFPDIATQFPDVNATSLSALGF
jgi:hypothetical protein